MKTLSLLFFLLLSTALRAQPSNEVRLNFITGYFGETITHPGLNFGVEYSPFDKGRYQTILAGTVGGYIHRRNNLSLFVRGQWGQRVTTAGGFFVDSFLGLGYLHQLPNGGKVYEVLPNGAVVEQATQGQPFLMPSVALGIGFDFMKSSNPKLAIFARPELFWKAPFNGYYLTHLALNAGVIYQWDK